MATDETSDTGDPWGPFRYFLGSWTGTSTGKPGVSTKAMVEEGRDCSDIMVQIAAVRSAVGQVGRVVLEDRVESCLLNAAADGATEEVWVDLQKAFGVFLKS